MANKELLAELLTKAINTINWDNWENEDEDGEIDGHHKLGDVYYCKLDWLKDHIEDEEMLGIIEDLQETICPILNLLDQE
jgi:hypothetical protein